ncbi:hypothetical protein [Nonomuraea rhizosphaerae]|uniref:hypothetical protein n=1 Tax=Nonomuraea rhizosphaerae TaxID=2665663 RepID=UPI001C5F0042|nr:hypothetical protein [Nonomuraea rhizosphaerae]
MHRTARAGAVCGALGVLWWATARVGWASVGCEEWNCLPAALGSVVAITAVMFGLAVVALELARVRPGVRVALVSAAVLLVLGVVEEALPSWPSRFAHVVTAGGAFALAGAVAAVVTDGEVARGRRVAALAAVPVLAAGGLAVLWWRRA